MAGIATVNVIGNLGRDPETVVTPTGRTAVKFSVAVSRKTRDGGETVAWYATTCWGSLAEKLTDLTQQGAIGKGSKVFVSGRLEPREYEKDGQTRTSLDLNANEVQVLEWRDGGQQGGQRVARRGDADFQSQGIEEIAF